MDIRTFEVGYWEDGSDGFGGRSDSAGRAMVSGEVDRLVWTMEVHRPHGVDVLEVHGDPERYQETVAAMHAGAGTLTVDARLAGAGAIVTTTLCGSQVHRLVREVGRVNADVLEEHVFRLSTGRIKVNAVLRRQPVVGVLPVRRGPAGLEVLLVDQFREPVRRVMREIVAGRIEDHERVQDPREVAARELAEEAGLHATEWRELATDVITCPGYSDEEITALYAVWGLSAVPKRDVDDHITSRWFLLEDVHRQLRTNQIGDRPTDTKTVLAIHALLAILAEIGLDLP